MKSFHKIWFLCKSLPGTTCTKEELQVYYVYKESGLQKLSALLPFCNCFRSVLLWTLMEVLAWLKWGSFLWLLIVVFINAYIK